MSLASALRGLPVAGLLRIRWGFISSVRAGLFFYGVASRFFRFSRRSLYAAALWLAFLKTESPAKIHRRASFAKQPIYLSVHLSSDCRNISLYLYVPINCRRFDLPS